MKTTPHDLRLRHLASVPLLALACCRPAPDGTAIRPIDASTEPPAATSLPSVPAPPKIPLRVALFPWIPDADDDGFKALRTQIESDFEELHPDIDVELRLEPWDDSYYNPPVLAGWLASSRYDLVEIDTVVLGDLISADIIEPWPKVPERDYLQAAIEGATTTEDGAITWWGVPHLNCGFFLITLSTEMDEARSIGALISATRKTGKPVLGNFASSWDLPTLYLDATVDNGLDPAALLTKPSTVPKSVKPPLDEPSAKALEQFSRLCKIGAKNPCIDGTFNDDWNGPVQGFVDGTASGFWGYSERLHLTVSLLKSRQQPSTDLRVSTMALGTNATPLLFTDAFVRRKGCSADPDCSRAAVAWADYITSDQSLLDLLTSKDAGENAIPRYLLPATKSALNAEPLASDPLYGELRPFAEAGHSVPTTGSLFERRRVLGYLLETRLGM